MPRIVSVLILSLASLVTLAQPQPNREIKLTVLSSKQAVLPHSTVSLLKTDSTLLRTNITDSSGLAVFTELNAGSYLLRVTRVGHIEQYSGRIDLAQETSYAGNIVLQEATGVLKDVTVTARKPFVQILPDKTVVNVEAGITNAGATVLEVLEKSPGVTVDRNGAISLKGRPGVLVMIDGKLTQLSGTDLQNLLSGMNASQIETIELMDNPSAKYDAAGNAGIINIKTKKNRQRGFNGSFTVSAGQGMYPRNNNNVVFNYRNGSFNYFLTYSTNMNQYMLDLYALRTYYKADGVSAEALLEQPYFTKGANKGQTLRTGADYFVNNKTTLGLVFTGTYFTRKNEGKSTALWMNASGEQDSTIYTNSSSDTKLQQAGVNVNARHVFSANKELTADIDFIKYDINTTQYFENKAASPGSIAEASEGRIPSELDIFSAKADYSHNFSSMQWETGVKTSRVQTSNPTQYFLRDGNGNWQEDLGKSNHFLYTENIHAAYTNLNAKAGRWNLQGGLRYELTTYKANQLGNAVTKDSTFNRNYGSLFPTAFVTWQADSVNSFTFRAGRRIDRPAFQKLNPFVFIINKYTFQTGNPYFKPQFTWNLELSHIYKETISTTVSYNIIRDYFSQIFYSDTSTGRITYSEGNVGKMQNFGLTVSTQLNPAKWWSFSGQATMNHKKFEGVLWKVYKASITQLNLSINNQLRFKKGWGAELSGFYTTRAQNDIQEVLDPTGQLSLGFSKQVMGNKGTLRLTFRDVFYTQSMAGWTYFNSVVEYFKLMRDSRVATISFTYRLGKAMKQQARRSSGAAGDEVQRVGTVN
ncbi:MAG TPA: outer membrane beta-barrel protein [Chitinophagaceae bacterium]|nr:outer membrane beta-barrel protein [Chitinophagaceae bacterium]